MICHNCQNDNPESAKFCFNCGTQLHSSTLPEGERKLVSVLFADVAGSTALGESLDPEEVTDIMNGMFNHLNKAVANHGGTVTRLMGDAILAIFGTPVAREDDPHRAIRAGLEIQESIQPYTAKVRDTYGVDFSIRVGVNTGVVVLDFVGDQIRTEFTAMGDTVNVASRLQSAAPPGGVLISQDTYRHTARHFSFKELDPIEFKGKSKSTQVYLVLGERDPSMQDLVSEPLQELSPLIGRSEELQVLQSTITKVFSDPSPGCQLVTIVGETGMGKSRLIAKFLQQMNGSSDSVRTMQAHAAESSNNMPYSLFHNLFARTFNILNSDDEEQARAKLIRGFTDEFGEGRDEWACFVGHLIGLDFSESPGLKDLLEDAEQIRDRAFQIIGEVIASWSTEEPLLLILEDIHGCDEGSLDLIEHIVQNCSTLPTLLLCTARPSLFLERTGWGTELPSHRILSLKPLSAQDSHKVIRSLLGDSDTLPDELFTLLDDRAEGNPFFLEEIVKMLIEEGVIHHHQGSYHVDLEQLSGDRVPATLRGVLQARLDSLPHYERKVLQIASVVGTTFWEAVLENLETDLQTADHQPPQGVGGALEELEAKTLILQAVSSFSDTREYLFKNSILHSVVYSSLLRRSRRKYHASVAAWLEERSVNRPKEFASRLAHHYELAGAALNAGDWYATAGRASQDTYSPTTAERYYRKALSLWDQVEEGSEVDPLKTIEVHQGLGQVLTWLGQYEAAEAVFIEMRKEAEIISHPLLQANAWHGLAETQMHRGELKEAVASAKEEEALARQVDGDLELAKGLWLQAWGAFRMGDMETSHHLAQQILELGEHLEDSGQRAHGLNLLGVLNSISGDFEEAATHFRSALRIFQNSGNRRRSMPLLNNLGVIAESQGDYVGAMERYEEALQTARDIGNRDGEMVYLSNLGGVKTLLGQHESAVADLLQVIKMAGDGGQDVLPAAYCSLARAYLGLGDRGAAAETGQKALSLAREKQSMEDQGLAWRVLGEVAAEGKGSLSLKDEQGEIVLDAGICFERSEQTFREIGREDMRAQTLRAWGRYEAEQGVRERGMSLWQEARSIFQKLGAMKELERMAEKPY